MGYLLDKFDYTRKAIVYAQQHDISRLNVKLNSLLKQRDIIKNGNMMRAPKIPDPKKYVTYMIMELAKVTIFVNPNPLFAVKRIGYSYKLAKPPKYIFVDTALMAAYKEQVDAPTKKGIQSCLRYGRYNSFDRTTIRNKCRLCGKDNEKFWL